MAISCRLCMNPGVDFGHSRHLMMHKMEEEECQRGLCQTGYMRFLSYAHGSVLSQVKIWMRTTHAEVRHGRTYGTFVHCLAFAQASNWPYINVSNANPLWSTDSQQIVFGCLPNVVAQPNAVCLTLVTRLH